MSLVNHIQEASMFAGRQYYSILCCQRSRIFVDSEFLTGKNRYDQYRGITCMAEGNFPVLNIYEDHPRWEEYKFDRFRNPNNIDLETFENSEGKDNNGESDCSEKRKDRAWAELNSRRMKPRRTLMRKEGQSNLTFKGIQKKRVKYLKDLYVTLLDLKWRWAILILFSGFFASYFIFSVLYFSLSYVHGDLDHFGDPKYRPCIKNLSSYWDAVLFSIETQSTIGYGTIYPNSDCPGALPLLFLQITLGFLMETILLGFIFVKIARPKYRRHTLVFSRNACICQEDKHLILQIRVGDMRNTHLIDTRMYGVLVKRYVSEEKYVYPLFQHEIEFEAHGMGSRLFLIWPMVVRHNITRDSPLYTLTPEDLLYDKFELFVVLEGAIESTGEMIQARTSYTSREIMWAHRFTRIEEYDEKNDKWCMDFLRFNNVVPSKSPRCSAKDLDDDPSRLNQCDPIDRPSHAFSVAGDGNRLTMSLETMGSDPAIYNTASEAEEASDEA